MLAEIYGRKGGCSNGRGGSMHLIDERVGFMGSTAIVANTIPIGVGLAVAIRHRGADAMAIIFLGDGATEEGVFYESANFAAVHNLSVLFVCENNLYSVYSSLRLRQPGERAIYKMVESMGIRASVGDGNDVVATYQQMQDVIASIRVGQGPAFVELSTYRWREHCGPAYDNHIGYRTVDEFEAWKKQDPLPRYETYLTEEAGWSRDRIDAVRQAVRFEIAADFAWAETQPYPEAGEAYTNVYAESLS